MKYALVLIFQFHLRIYLNLSIFLNKLRFDFIIIKLFLVINFT